MVDLGETVAGGPESGVARPTSQTSRPRRHSWRRAKRDGRGRLGAIQPRGTGGQAPSRAEPSRQRE